MSKIKADVKHVLEIPDDEDFFNTDVLLQVNMGFAMVSELGAGPDGGYYLTSEMDPEWDEYMAKSTLRAFIEQYITLSSKMVFNPPKSAKAIEANNNLINKLEFMIKLNAGGG